MKLVDLLKDKVIGMYIDILKGEKKIAGIYQGMEKGKFMVKSVEEVNEGDNLEVRLSIGGWNFIFPCVVEKVGENRTILKPLGKVKIREKRKEKRVPILKKCVINSKRGLMLDASYHGTRILSTDEYNIGDIVEVEVEGNAIKGIVRWMKPEEVDLKSVGVMIENATPWWMDYVKERLAEFASVLRRM